MEEEARKQEQVETEEEKPKAQTREEKRLEAARKRRETRIDPGKMTKKMSYPEREGYHRHWINDYKGKVPRALDKGYMFVEKTPGLEPGDPGATSTDTGENRVSLIVGTQDGGAPLVAYLMEIPQEWYDEDMAVMFGQIDEIEKSMMRGEDERGRPGVDGRYIPT